jgi:hypothetical protein
MLRLHEKADPGLIGSAGPAIGPRLGLSILIALFTIACCISLVVVANYQHYMSYYSDRLAYAVVSAAAFYLVSFLFVLARFSFGYFVGFHFYAMALGFLWFSSFSKFHYDQKLAAISAAASAILFLLPAVLINAPIRQLFTLTAQNLGRLLDAILLLALATITVASFYNFRLTSLAHIYDFRNALYFPGIVRYLIGIVSSALLPFAFACCLALGRRWKAAFALLLMLLFYPVTLSKLALFAPVWTAAVVVLSRFSGPKTTTILLVLLPMLFGLSLIGIFPHGHPALDIFGLINIRMIATPSSAMDIYNDFFANHPLTHFCQISVLKPFVNCPYQEPLSVIMDNVYGLGNLNASLFATEGIASVGPYFAPLTAFVCGLVVAAGNRASSGLPPRFILVSAALLPQILLNTPFTTALLTHGVAILFLLWYVVPREIFRGNADMMTSSAGPARW